MYYTGHNFYNKKRKLILYKKNCYTYNINVKITFSFWNILRKKLHEYNKNILAEFPFKNFIQFPVIPCLIKMLS